MARCDLLGMRPTQTRSRALPRGRVADGVRQARTYVAGGLGVEDVGAEDDEGEGAAARADAGLGEAAGVGEGGGECGLRSVLVGIYWGL